ncbi:hypothetical protein M622_02020 [Thauera terpenica 58Eu]|jgi:MOSC domain-containing protein YiiM|uniref:MOSC domain-containing protein n=1 Tax=Thauera terpenica 58Eu TaxID=1348657 RepID=S9ZF02_9RHOO|nr:MOSC domain-containing protein [Thauera terpenica]EPZ15970.1 hypothetical protein M622_02020 [Thauera terpenica 58Eu]MBP6760835.1 MOSC domain-containing protein [Thauera sp.]
MKSRIDQIFTGRVKLMLPDGEPSGIFKSAVDGPQHLGTNGLEGDEQADLRYHGGPEKALHQYPAEHYALLAQEWPQCASLLGPGVLGENISTRGMTEHDVCIGDVFGMGEARIQLSQPRSPCWKIDRRLKVDGASRFVEAAGVTGWYYRVLDEGRLCAGDEIVLLERPNPWLTLVHYWDTVMAHRPDPVALRQIAAAAGLATDKAQRWLERAAWLEANAG